MGYEAQSSLPTPLVSLVSNLSLQKTLVTLGGGGGGGGKPLAPDIIIHVIKFNERHSYCCGSELQISQKLLI